MEQAPSSQEIAEAQEKQSEALTTTEANQEDLQWTTARKKWPNYWIRRLSEEKENLPGNLKQLVEDSVAKKKIKHKGKKMGELGKYVTTRLDGINHGIFPEIINLGENEAIEIKQESKNLNDTIELSGQANELILNQKLLPFLSSQEQRDISMTMSKKGAMKYWVNRLTPELDILRNDIKEIVEEVIKTKKGPRSEKHSALA